MKPIIVKDMTKLFNKEILLYSFFDLALKKPLRIVYLMYLILLLIIWSLPWGMLLFPLNVYEAMFVFGPSFVLANMMSKPIWGGKSFFSWFRCQIRYITSKKKYYDGKAISKLPKFKIEYNISVSRRKDFNKLFLYIKEQKETKHKKERDKSMKKQHITHKEVVKQIEEEVSEKPKKTKKIKDKPNRRGGRR